MTLRRISYAQNAEDIRVWRAFHRLSRSSEASGNWTYVDVGANDPRQLSITASLYDLGWRGLLIEADPQLAEQLRVHRPDDIVVERAAAAGPGELTFHRVPGTGLGTLDEAEARAARARGFDVETIVVRADALDDILDQYGLREVHFMSIDVEGAEAAVLQGLSRHHPWVLCIEAVYPGTTDPSHEAWEAGLLALDYRFAAFDGVNRWYVSVEHAELIDAIATPFNAVDAGEHGWVVAELAASRQQADRAAVRRAWQRELILHRIETEVPRSEYERQIAELRDGLVAVEGSRAFRFSRRAARIAKKVMSQARLLAQRLPGPTEKAVVRRRHLKHVIANMDHLTNPAYLGRPPEDIVSWIGGDWVGPVPPEALSLTGFTAEGASAAHDWLRSGPYDTDALLERRTDNLDDEVGRTAAALRVRLALADRPGKLHWAGGRQVLFDARCLQTAAFGARGIGRFARAALLGAREAIGDDRLVLLVDLGLESLPAELAGGCRQIVRVREQTVPAFSVLIQPSPMTATAEPLIPILHSTAYKIAIVFDFIPTHYPTIYLNNPAARSEYAAALDALRCFDSFVCISHLVRRELERAIDRPTLDAVVAWPRDVLASPASASRGSTAGPVVVMTGDEPRKNTFGALAAIGAATAGLEEPRDVVVMGLAGQDTRVHHWSIAAAMRPGEVRTAGHLSDEEMSTLLHRASVVVVASFDEGLSLPVIEAIRAGVPVVASDIPAHRELIGSGSFLAEPGSPRSLEKAIRRHAGRTSTHARQVRTLGQHRHDSLEAVIGALAVRHVKAAAVVLPAAAVYVGGRALKVGIGTPWSPQRTGVADFSTTTTIELARLCDVTAYVTAGADVAASIPAGVRLRSAPMDELLARGSRDDVFVSVVGNSHFHLPFLEATRHVDSVVISHDTRLVELYMALRGRGGVEQLMLRGTSQRALIPPLDEQIDDMRLLQNAGFWEVARRARMLILHSPTAAARIGSETGIVPRLLPFANQRYPEQDHVTPELRRAARTRLGFDVEPFAGTVHLASFGFVDVRTKMTDVVIEAAAWLSQWGVRVSLHLVGAAGPEQVKELTDRARPAGIENFRVTGFIADKQFRDYLLAVDIGVQLRISPLLGVSGPLSDLAAYGTPSIASGGLAVDVDTPAYVDRLPDDVSPVMVAEAIEYRLAHPMDHAEREQLRRDYLDRKSPRRYAEQLLGLLTESSGSVANGS